VGIWYKGKHNQPTPSILQLTRHPHHFKPGVPHPYRSPLPNYRAPLQFSLFENRATSSAWCWFWPNHHPPLTRCLIAQAQDRITAYPTPLRSPLPKSEPPCIRSQKPSPVPTTQIKSPPCFVRKTEPQRLNFRFPPQIHPPSRAGQSPPPTLNPGLPQPQMGPLYPLKRPPAFVRENRAPAAWFSVFGPNPPTLARWSIPPPSP
jgi:hypothetical protein